MTKRRSKRWEKSTAKRIDAEIRAIDEREKYDPRCKECGVLLDPGQGGDFCDTACKYEYESNDNENESGGIV